jgi:hypothetical protein
MSNIPLEINLISSITPKKEAWWIISEDNKYFPSYYPFGLTQYVYEILFFLI